MRILVTAASKYGGTAGIAEAIGRTLENESLEVDVLPVDEVSDLEGYDSVVLGSGVYAGRWLRSARRFADEHADALSEKPTWLFSSGPIGDFPAGEPLDVGELLRTTRARGHHLFGGRLVTSSLGLRERAFARLLHVPAGDFREWAAAAAWATAIARTLANEQGVASQA